MTDTRTLVPTRTLVTEGRVVRRVRAYRLVLTLGDGTRSAHELTAPSIRIGSRDENDIVVRDESVSRIHASIEIDEHGYRLRDLESTNGTFADGMRVRDVHLRPGAVVRLGHATLELTALDHEADVPATAGDRFGPLVGSSVVMRELFATLERAAKTDATVLVEGETGTGKELVARAVHEHSKRAGGPFVVLDCASVPASLLESELFGHEKGAFTGATSRRIGRIEEAEGGTLFLDELGELPLDLQPKLLRALEQREVRRVGGQDTFRVDFRTVAATNRDLALAVNRGSFREDLYYRLAVVRVTVPPLRERREDVRSLVAHFVERALRDDPGRARATLAQISEENYRRLERHPWPGNVRQLRNVLERTLALASGGDPVDVPLPTVPHAAHRDGAAKAGAASFDLDRPFVDLKQEVMAAFERDYLEAQLARHDGNWSRAAAAAGIDRMYFKRLLKKYRE